MAQIWVEMEKSQGAVESVLHPVVLRGKTSSFLPTPLGELQKIP